MEKNSKQKEELANKKEDNKEAYSEFMEEELAHIRKEKNIVKTKKM